MTTKYTVGGVEYETCSTEQKPEITEVFYSKEFHSSLDNKGKLDLIKQIEAKQQMIFTAHTISANNPKTLSTTICFPKMSLSVNGLYPNMVSILTSLSSSLYLLMILV